MTKNIWQLINNNINHVYLRLGAVLFIFTCLFLTISYRLVYIVAFGGAAEITHIAKKAKYYRRDIIDTNGTLLATSIPSASLFANPSKILNKEDAASKLKKTFPDIDQNKLLSELSSEKNFVWVKRDLLPEEQDKVYFLGIPGLDFEHEQKRVYTYGKLTSHILGYVGRDNEGLAGIERSLDSFMKEDGEKIQLSIDIRVQNIVSEELEKVVSKHRAIGGVGIVVDPTNGQVIAMVSKPDFDSYNPSKATKDQLFNRASMAIYDIGSAFKTITFAVAFDTNTITLQDAYNLQSNFRVANFTVKDYHKHEGWHTIGEIFMHSSNIGAAQIGLEVGKNKFKEYMKSLGMLDVLSIEIPEKGRPLYPSDNQWTDLSTTTMSYGYGLCISPLHFVQANIPIVNGGTFYQLTFLKNQQKGKQVFSESTSENMNKLLRLVVKHGTGKRADVTGYMVAGKTGTANKLQGKRYVENSRLSSFIGTFPSTNPKFLVYVLLDDPKGTQDTFGFATAGFTAAPTVGAIISRIVTLYGLEPASEEEQESLDFEYEMKKDET